MLTRIIGLVAAGLIAAPLATASAAPPAPPASAEAPPAPAADALALARLMQPEALILDLAERSFAMAMDDMLRNDELLAAEDKKRPGLIKDIVRDVSAAFRRHTATTIPSAHRRYANLYMELFTPDERGEMIRLFSSPVGQKLIAAKMASFDLAPMVKGIMANPDAKTSTEQMTSLNRASAQKAAASLSEADGQAIMKLVRPATMLKMRATTQRIMQLEAELANEEDPTLDAVLDQAMKNILKEKGLDS